MLHGGHPAPVCCFFAGGGERRRASIYEGIEHAYAGGLGLGWRRLTAQRSSRSTMEKMAFLCRRLAPHIFTVLLTTFPVLAWGPTGHRAIALIAWQRLSPEARGRVERLLFNGKYTIEEISVCADEIRSRNGKSKIGVCTDVGGAINGDTGPWHYIDIPLTAAGTDLSKYCPRGDCIVDKIESFTRTLRESTNDAERRTALLFVVHFMGDIHQPLHCVERACDQGGNRELVNFYLGKRERANTRLHTVWDVDMVAKLMRDSKLEDEGALVSTLLGRLDSLKVQRWVKASVPEIAWEGHELAAKKVYPGIPFQDFCSVPPPAPNPATDLTGAYEQSGAQVARDQLAKAGVRLAALLEANLTH